MTKAELQKELQQLPLDEQLELASEVMERGAPEATFVLSDAQKELLEERRRDVVADPQGGSSAKEVHTRIFSDL